MVGRLFQNCRFKNAVFAPTSRDYIDSMVNKIGSICTTFDSIMSSEVEKLDSIRAWFNSIIHGGENRLDSAALREENEI